MSPLFLRVHSQLVSIKDFVIKSRVTSVAGDGSLFTGFRFPSFSFFFLIKRQLQSHRVCNSESFWEVVRIGAPWLWKYRFNQNQINHPINADVLVRRCYAHSSAWWARNYHFITEHCIQSVRVCVCVAGGNALQKAENGYMWVKRKFKEFPWLSWMKKQPDPNFNSCRSVANFFFFFLHMTSGN